MSENYKLLEEDVIEFFKKVLGTKNIATEIKFYFLEHSKQKRLIKICKIPDQYALGMDANVLVVINSSYYDNIKEDLIKNILFEQEIDRIEYDYQKNKIKIGKSNLITSKGVVEKYNIKEVERAIEIEEMLEKQGKENIEK